MESILETPAKRRKIEDGYVSRGYNSPHDSGEDVFDAYETVDTVPLPVKRMPQEAPSTCTQHLTQPTQIIPIAPVEGTQSPDSPCIQVSASSPPAPVRHQRPSSILAKSIAPAGTAFRPPVGVVKAHQQPTQKRDIVTISDVDDDDGLPKYEGGSSDEESQLHKADIKPSSFAIDSSKAPLPDSSDRFREVTARLRYDPSKDHPVAISKAQAQHNASQAFSATTQPMKDIPIDSIGDIQMRRKIKQMMTVYPSAGVLDCRDALLKKMNNYQDAMDYLSDLQQKSSLIDLTTAEETQTTSTNPAPIGTVIKPTAKQHLKEPVKKIHEKWTSTHAKAKAPSRSPPPVPLTPPKPRRRLVQGRRKNPVPTDTLERPHLASPIPENLVVTTKPVDPRGASPQAFNLSGTDSDSGFGDASINEDERDTQICQFFNTCSVPNLVDIAAISEATAKLLVSQRPFASLNAIREIQEVAVANGSHKIRQPKRIYEKIVDKVLEMWKGYEAVDSLIEHCKDISTPLGEALRKWGIDVSNSASKAGELEVVDIDTVGNSSRDSGIGTPSSRCTSMDRDENYGVKPGSTRRNGFFSQPSNMNEDVVLKDYQVIGFNWLSLLFHSKLSGILADDMGLGKTCQVIAFLAHLLEQGVSGPHLVIVPSSTLENWLREFSVFCSGLKVVPYYGSQKERPAMQEQILSDSASINVVITTYNLAKVKGDNVFLRKLKPVCVVYDEGHMLKNSKAAGYGQYMRIKGEFRLLLTGTPLQNNLHELCSLLGFILPSVFQEHTRDLEAIFSHKARTTGSDDSHAALLSTQRISRAKSMMSPFILRRKKHQVLKHLPQKTKRIEYCQLSQSQQQLYALEQQKAIDVFIRRQADETTGSETTNIMMNLRKASIHPLLFRHTYDNAMLNKLSRACLKEKEFQECNANLVWEDMSVMNDIELHLFCERYAKSMSKFALKESDWMDSGKVDATARLLKQYKRDGDRVLIFSQFTQVLNILELVLESLGMRFFRLDGSTKVEERQTMIDEFYQDPDITVFLLSTKAGGAGINLACANKVIIFDSSFNPQDDIQAENRAHRVGQKREVEVVRLVTKGTIEEQIHALGQTKLALDDRVAGVVDEKTEKQAETKGMKAVEEMLASKLASKVADTAGGDEKKA